MAYDGATTRSNLLNVTNKIAERKEREKDRQHDKAKQLREIQFKKTQELTQQIQQAQQQYYNPATQGVAMGEAISNMQLAEWLVNDMQNRVYGSAEQAIDEKQQTELGQQWGQNNIQALRKFSEMMPQLSSDQAKNVGEPLVSDLGRYVGKDYQLSDVNTEKGNLYITDNNDKSLGVLPLYELFPDIGSNNTLQRGINNAHQYTGGSNDDDMLRLAEEQDRYESELMRRKEGRADAELNLKRRAYEDSRRDKEREFAYKEQERAEEGMKALYGSEMKRWQGRLNAIEDENIKADEQIRFGQEARQALDKLKELRESTPVEELNSIRTALQADSKGGMLNKILGESDTRKKAVNSAMQYISLLTKLRTGNEGATGKHAMELENDTRGQIIDSLLGSEDVFNSFVNDYENRAEELISGGLRTRKRNDERASKYMKTYDEFRDEYYSKKKSPGEVTAETNDSNENNDSKDEYKEEASKTYLQSIKDKNDTDSQDLKKYNKQDTGATRQIRVSPVVVNRSTDETIRREKERQAELAEYGFAGIDEPTKTEKAIRKFNEDTEKMFRRDAKDIKAYEERTKLGHGQNNRSYAYGVLTKDWERVGGAVKYDSEGNKVLDIDEQNKRAKADSSVPDAMTLLKSVAVTSEEGKKYYSLKDKYIEGGSNIGDKLYSIDVSMLTPSESEELQANTQSLIDAGITGYHSETKTINTGEKGGNSLVKLFGRGVSGVVDFAMDALKAFGKAGNDRDLPLFAFDDQGKLKEDNTDLGYGSLTKAYDKKLHTSDPVSFAGKVSETAGSFVMPSTGGATVLAKLGKPLMTAISGAIGEKSAEELVDWIELTPKERAQRTESTSAGSQLAKVALGLAGGVVGISSGDALINKTAEKVQKTINKEAVKALEEDTYKLPFIIDKEKFNSAGREAVELSQIVNSQGRQADRVALQSLKLGKIEGLDKTVAEVLPNDFKVEIPEWYTEKADAIIRKANKGKSSTEGELKQYINDESLKPFKEKMGQLRKESGSEYEELTKDLKDVPFVEQNRKKVIAGIKQEFDITDTDEVGKLFSSSQERRANYYFNKISKADNYKDVQNVIQELNKDLRHTSEASERYVLDTFKSKLRGEIAEVGENNPVVGNYLVASKGYSEKRKELEGYEDILEKLTGGKGQNIPAEQLSVSDNIDAYQAYKKLSTSEKKALLNNLPEETANKFREIDSFGVTGRDLTKLSDEELELMFAGNEELKAERGRLAEFVNSGGNNGEIVLGNALDMYRSNRITADQLNSIVDKIKKKISANKANKLGEYIDGEVKLHSNLADNVMIKRLNAISSEGAGVTENIIKNASDVESLNRISKHVDAKYCQPGSPAVVAEYGKNLNNLITKVKEEKQAKLANKFADMYENALKGLKEKKYNYAEASGQMKKVGEAITAELPVIKALSKGNAELLKEIEFVEKDMLPKMMRDITAKAENITEGIMSTLLLLSGNLFAYTVTRIMLRNMSGKLANRIARRRVLGQLNEGKVTDRLRKFSKFYDITKENAQKYSDTVKDLGIVGLSMASEENKA